MLPSQGEDTSATLVRDANYCGMIWTLHEALNLVAVGSIPTTAAQSVVTSGRRLVLETRICRFEAGRSDHYSGLVLEEVRSPHKAE